LWIGFTRIGLMTGESAKHFMRERDREHPAAHDDEEPCHP
jgi:hypothetical protein